MERISYCTKPYEADTCTNEQCVFKNCCYYYLIGKKKVIYSSNTTVYETMEKKHIGFDDFEQTDNKGYTIWPMLS